SRSYERPRGSYETQIGHTCPSVGTRGTCLVYSTTHRTHAGSLPLSLENRYVRDRVQLPAGAAWVGAWGVGLEEKPAGGANVFASQGLDVRCRQRRLFLCPRRRH